MPNNTKQIADLARAIAAQAEAIAAGTNGAPYATARLIADNADTLCTWLADHRSRPPIASQVQP